MWQVLGQSKATMLLSRSIEADQLSHAYMFVGPDHVGKLTLAINLAQAVNCQAEGDVPCGTCGPCRRIAAGKHSDIQIIGPLSQEKKGIGIKQIEDMQSDASLPPYEGKCKVFILDKADSLSHDAANRLLKTLEEPLPHVLIILLTARERDMLQTIVSRCQRVELRPLPITLAKEALSQSYGIGEEQAELMARLSGGCLGWALQALQDEALMETRNQRLAAIIDLVRAGPIQRLAYAAGLAARFSKDREEVEEVLNLWREWWHDLLLIKAGNGEAVTNLDCRQALVDQAEGLSLTQVAGFIRHLQDASRQLEQNVNPRLALEVLMLNMP
jgi:DNA polymerase-3 subunit delta'